MKIRLKPLLGGIATRLLPSIATTMAKRNQPQVGADYFYTVWMRHMCSAAHFNCWIAPKVVLEIGPGTFPGTGIAALLSGADQYLALDPNPKLARNFDEVTFQALLAKFKEQASFAEKDRIVPSTAFPGHLLSNEILQRTLSAEHLDRIRQSVIQRAGLVCYLNSLSAITAESVDFLFSHSVLEHVENLSTIYQEMWRCLRPGGVMTHSVDLSAHGTSSDWNGHWTIPDAVWHFMQGKRVYFINREPASTHLALVEEAGFEIKTFHTSTLDSSLARADLAPSFRHLSDADLKTCSVFIVARKPNE